MEADHVAAVAALATRSRSLRDGLRLGAAWGLGHTITLVVVGGAVLWSGSVVPERVAGWLELLVGIMLVGLGADVVRRMVRDRIHFHTHRHERTVHFHAHSHRGDPPPHGHSAHGHDHGLAGRALLVGLVHGLAGSAALVLLTLAAAPTPWIGVGYMILFGIGSMAGMALLSVAIAIPLRYAATALTWAYNGLTLAAGLTTTGLGIWIVVHQSRILG